MDDWRWFRSGWGRFGTGGEPPTVPYGTPILCVGGPLNGQYRPRDYAMYHPVRLPGGYWESNAATTATTETIVYEPRRWIVSMMAMPIPLWVLEGLGERETRTHLDQLGYSFGD